MKELTKSRERILTIVMLLVLTAAYLLIGTQKSYLHMDEAYSFGLSNYDRVDIFHNKDFYDTWHDGDYYNDYLIVDENERWDFSPVYDNQRDDVHPPLYYFCLRLFMEANAGRFSMWTGILLNVLLQIPATLLLLGICRRLFGNFRAACAVTFLASLSMACVSSVIYIRMYAMCGLWVLLTLWLHLRMEERESLYPLLPAVGMAAVCGSLTHYYYLIFLAALALLFAVRLLRRKQWLPLGAYVATMCVAAGISLLIFPYSLTHLFSGYRGKDSVAKLADGLSPLKGLAQYVGVTTLHVFHWVLIAMGLLGIAILVYALRTRKKITWADRGVLHMVWIPVLFYFLAVGTTSPYIDLRYIMPICTLLFVICAYLIYSLVTSVGTKKFVRSVFACLIAAYLLLPVVTRAEPDKLYTGWKPLEEQLSGEYNLPAVYCFRKNNQRFLDDIYLFTLLDESYIAPDVDCTEETFRRIFDGKDTSGGVIVFINNFQDDERILTTVQNALGLREHKKLSELNAGAVYYVG